MVDITKTIEGCPCIAEGRYKGQIIDSLDSCRLPILFPIYTPPPIKMDPCANNVVQTMQVAIQNDENLSLKWSSQKFTFLNSLGVFAFQIKTMGSKQIQFRFHKLSW
jgi:hypothetical protein